MENDISQQQKYLGRKGLILFLAAASSFPALSTDLYLPALPTMTAYFGCPEYQTNLTLILFFVFYAVAILLWGPLSDRFGRRPVLIVGLTCYTVAGVLCAVAPNVFQLMVSRALQALGAGAATTVATAIVKDAYQGRKREVTITAVHSMAVFAPLVAPILGAQILKVTSWRGTFVAQAVLGLIMVVGAIVFQETLVRRLAGNPLASLKRLGVVLKNKTFAYLLINTSLIGMATMAFVASSSYIYEVNFGVSSQTYSLFFALYAVGVVLGPPCYLVLSRRIERTAVVTACFTIAAISGLLVLLVGTKGPWPFILALFPTPLVSSCLRPPATYLLLGQHEEDAGSVSSLVIATYMVMGSVGTLIVSLELWNRMLLIGTLVLGLAGLSLLLWLGWVRLLVREQPEVARDGA